MKAKKKHIGLKLKKYNSILDKTYFYLVDDVTVKGKFILTNFDENFKKGKTSFMTDSIETYEEVG